jgi:protein O-GlcNAc transferase
MQTDLAHVLQESDALRRSAQWAQARSGYQQALVHLPDDATVAHNLALCHLALGETGPALVISRQALKLRPSLWQAALVHAKALIASGDKNAALALLERLHTRQPQHPDICIELARMLIQQGGDAARAVDLVRPFLDSAHQRDARLVYLIGQLYDRDTNVKAAELSQAICDFADAHLQTPPESITKVPGTHSEAISTHLSRPTTSSPRLRVGLLSPQFTASPVYFFTYSVFERLAREVDLVFISRGTKSDWASQAFRRIATDWIDAAHLTAQPLSHKLASLSLDVLIDLGGWMDPVGLQALSTKPARRLFKWVGGQSATTGMRVFDGFITDRHQTPTGTDHLYSEPLLRLKAGYVTYTPPPYLPAAKLPNAAQAHLIQLGVIANPTKISRSFLADLNQRLPRWQTLQAKHARQVSLHFIDSRFRNEQLRKRLQSLLPDIQMSFITPGNHLDYLTAVSQLDATLDTWPYSGGLTTIESLAVGVPAYTRTGELFCERHTEAHCQYAGMRLSEYRIDRFKGFAPHARSGKSLIRAQTPRTDHDTLAAELLRHLSRK